MVKTIQVGKVKIGGKNPFILIAGPCVIENKSTVEHIAKSLKAITAKVGVPFIFKASYDKANRTSIKSFRGPGIINGLKILHEIKQKFNVPILSDVHSSQEIDIAKEVLDIIQIPAFLCRQTDLLVKAGESKKVVNVKKGQFLAPHNMNEVIKKIEATGNKKILLTERGSTFGYNNLVTDFRSMPIMRQLGYPVVMDASHCVQQPGGLGHASGGCSEFIPLLARCGIAAGCDALFIEVHPNPKKALSDGPNMLSLKQVESLLRDLKRIDKVVKNK